MFAILLAKCTETSVDGFTVTAICGDLHVSYITTDSGYMIMGKNKDGATVLEMPDWITEDLTMPEDERNAYRDEILSALAEFGKTE